MPLLPSLIRCSSAYDAALTAGRLDIAAEIERMATAVAALVGAAVTSRPIEHQELS